MVTNAYGYGHGNRGRCDACRRDVTISTNSSISDLACTPALTSYQITRPGVGSRSLMLCRMCRSPLDLLLLVAPRRSQGTPIVIQEIEDLQPSPTLRRQLAGASVNVDNDNSNDNSLDDDAA